ncbi:hypothetical protein MRB53_041870 [Persea americana]|nr:hypothetical protein MRB53_041870 [Persea americana]
MGKVRTRRLAEEHAKWILFDKEVSAQDKMHAAAALGANGALGIVMWDAVRDEWEQVKQVKVEVEKFFADKDTRSFDRILKMTLDNVASNAKYMARDEKAILEWLESKGYGEGGVGREDLNRRHCLAGEKLLQMNMSAPP